MDVNAIASLATQLSQQKLAQQLDIAVIKKTLEVQEQSLDSLLGTMNVALEAPPSTQLPANLGNYINTTA
ncbi:YjfB family protein [Thiorhodospira sibirica]|uniref:YjfB family protein n=1 Tax=Thiorhodospira sibirica TaxID=154347 RepID=UPI00022C1781|nr:YjfB family protein [Thiorhodospira sibirica]